MTEAEVQQTPLGLYRVFWKSGGSSLAAVCNTREGKRWLAPTNWVNGPTTGCWEEVDRVEMIVARPEGGVSYDERMARANIVKICRGLAEPENYVNDNQIMQRRYDQIASEVEAPIL